MKPLCVASLALLILTCGLLLFERCRLKSQQELAEQAQRQEKNKQAELELEADKQRWKEFKVQLYGLQDAFVQEPTRPLYHWRQEIIKLHYLWLNARDVATVSNTAEARAKIDEYVVRLVRECERQDTRAEDFRFRFRFNFGE